MSSEQQIHNLIARYTHYVDQARFDKVGDLFANGGDGNFRLGNFSSHWQEIFHITQHQIQ
ncbi:nuclear transport factor 2 family protein [Pedobacter kyonggii]|uniref:SnoaL-like domain-containing protein n=1 Tax=Pedobacter kyonggii TaxID=1926871 RepID=A0A4Q9H3U6_9SPHI|nr:nuclear transport factor 2 family protein [Pedobacter kyonggii]TBO36438.1 hypothetical protein EYS08_24570 [Pedobacter kyonggii]